VHFTREPIIESVITARDGYKLTVRKSKGNENEEYVVEAVEIISFGNALFFRCLEKPKAFLLPVTDYEVLETKETRVLLKSVSLEKSIKIGGGREGSMRTSKEIPVERESSEGTLGEEETALAAPQDQRLDKRRDRRRHRRRRSNDERSEMKDWSEKKSSDETASSAALGGDALSDETITTVSSPLFGTLIPPPTTLISETLARYKDTILMENPLPPTKVNEPPATEEHEEKRKHEEYDGQNHIAPHVHRNSSEDDVTFP